jgi:hypothetical protein
MIIGLTGKARSGKDTAAAQLVKNGFEHYWFSKPMKDACKAIFGWTDEHLYGELKEVVDKRFGVSPRQALQTLGTEWGRDCVSKSLWVDIAKIKMQDADNIVISDLRFDNEAEAIRDMGGYVVEIVRGDVIQVNSHTSESGISKDLISCTIKNNSSIEQLNQEINYIFLTETF